MRSFLSRNYLLIFILLLAIVLRFYKLGEVPPHLNWDEASNGYNAYSILKTGRDEYGNFMPLTFKSFGDYNLALSVYTLTPPVAIFGLNQFAVRLPSAIFGIIAVFLTYLLALKIFKNRFVAVFSSLFLAISPWHLQFSRYDHEANFMQTFILTAVTIYFYFKEKVWGLCATAAFLGLALNTYHGAKILVPEILLLLVIFDFKNLRRYGKTLALPFLVLFIFSLPIILNFQNSLIRGQSVGIFNKENPLRTFVSGYLSHFNPNFLFTTGDQNGRHAPIGMGELYVFEIPLIIVGLLALISSKSKPQKFLLLWLLLAPIPAAMSTPTPHALRAITFLPLWQIISAFGFYKVISTRMNFSLKTALIGAIMAVGLYNFSLYLHIYYSHYPRQKALDWQDGYRQVFSFTRENGDKYATIAISNYYGHPYIFTLFYTAYDPASYQKFPNGRDGFDKYEFFGSSWEKTRPGKAMLVTPFWQSHPPKVLKEIYSTDRDLRFIISETE